QCHSISSYQITVPRYSDHPPLHSFPTRRSSDLDDHRDQLPLGVGEVALLVDQQVEVAPPRQELVAVDGLRLEHVGHEAERLLRLDRKSTRLNSSHVKISYAVFCLKKNTDYMD